jgi:hypothetical protein
MKSDKKEKPFDYPPIQVNIFTLWRIWKNIRVWYRKVFLHVEPPKPQKFQFGKKAVRIDKRTLMMSRYVMPYIPPPPTKFDNLLTVYTKLNNSDPTALFPMDGNDRLGDCTIAGIAHALTIYNGLIGDMKIPSEKDVITLYKKLGCGRDNGLVMLDVLNHWRKRAFYEHKILAYVKIDSKNHEHVKQAIQLFGGVYLGFRVQINTIYDFENRQPWTPGILGDGGHAIFATSYDVDTLTVLTWGNTQKGTWAWWDQTVDEAYAILPVEAQEPGFAPGFDFETLKNDLISITN